ncbi:MAG: arsenite/tail-anchored protein-transporting ATPase [Solirubrobacteraceae bacterium]|nr:arsenite/tail-anchored protein-transporting ATPase [Solirubrobacteraceae bacterium]
MPARTILYTGKGGVGKTSVAAATARRCAAQGLRTIVLSTDPAHSLSDSLGVRLGPQPTQIGACLWGQEVAAQEELERNWSAVQGWLGDILIERGVDRISAEELTVPPGLDELFSLLALRRHHESDAYQVIVVDCAPTGETLRLLSFPDVARWWLEKIFPAQNQLLAAARPIARAMLDISLPGEAVLEDVNRLVANLIAMNAILRDHRRVSIRLVTNPDRMVTDESRRTFTYLNLYGFLTDAVIVNRVFPPTVGPYFAAWRERQQEQLAGVEAAFAPVPVLQAPYFETEVQGPAMLDRLGDAVFAGCDPAAVLHQRLAHELQVDEHAATLRLDLPLAEKGQISLKKIGLEVVVRVDGHKRTIMLPPGLRDFRPTGAAFEDGALEVSFVDGRVR